MAKMYLCFRRDESLIGKAIRILTCGPKWKDEFSSNHVYIRFEDDDEAYQFEATGGQRFGPVSGNPYPPNSTTWIVGPMEANGENALKWCHMAASCREHRYGYVQIAQNAFQILTGIHVGLVNSPWASAWVCSEAAVRALFVAAKNKEQFVELSRLGDYGWNGYWPSGGRNGGSVWDLAMHYSLYSVAKRIDVDKNGSSRSEYVPIPIRGLPSS